MAITKATTLANFASGITGIGSVGIGTTDPRLDLEINGDARLSDNSPRIEFHDLNAVANTNCTGGFEVYDQNGSRGIFVGATEGANQINFGVSGVERARVTQQGIGIGTTGSSHPLTVNEGSSGNKFLLLQKNSGQTLFTINEDGDNHIILNAAHASGELKVETNSIERLHIDSSGNIGIGTDSVGNISNRSQVVIGGVTGGLLDFNVGGDTEGRLFATDATGLTIRASQSDGNIIFQTGGSNERLRIKSDGKVGISQDDPNATLHLGGDAAAHGDATNPAFQIGGTGSYRFGIYTENENAVIACPNGDNGIKISVKTWGTAAQFINSAWSKDSVNYPGIILGGDSEHVVGYGNSIATTGDVGDNTFIRGRNVEIYTYDRIFFRTGSGSIDWMRFYSGTGTASMNLSRDGYLLLGYQSSNGSYRLQVNYQIYATSSTIATSDQRYKENIQSLDGCYDIVKQLNPVSFTWKNDANVYHPTEMESYESEILDDDGNKTGTFETITSPKMLREGHHFPTGTQVGFLAQEVQSTLSGKSWVDSIVKSNSRPQYDDDGNKLSEDESFYGIAEGNMISVLTSALKESIAKIEELQIKVTSLESHVGIAST